MLLMFCKVLKVLGLFCLVVVRPDFCPDDQLIKQGVLTRKLLLSYDASPLKKERIANAAIRCFGFRLLLDLEHQRGQ